MASRQTTLVFAFSILSLATAPSKKVSAANPTLQITVSDAAGTPMPCRVHLKDSQGRAQKAAGRPFFRDHFVFPGRVAVELTPGRYTYEIERGPEFERLAGTVQIEPGKNTELKRTLSRIANLRDLGWYSADLHIHRPVQDVQLLAEAEDLDYAPVITWWNDRNQWQDAAVPVRTTRAYDGRYYNVMAGEDEREGGALLFFGLNEPLGWSSRTRETPSPMLYVEQARRINPRVWIDVEKPFWWDVPVWLASGKMNSIGLANNHMCRSRMLENEAWGKPRDVKQLPPPRGNGFWTQQIYYHVLDAGLRIPPSAGSASGVLPNPVGYNRVYVHLDQPFKPAAWFESLAKGRCFVSNGPLLLAKANGRLPGETFHLDDGGKLTIQVDVSLISSDVVPKIELIHNGKAAQSVDCADDVSQERTLTLTVDEPGWFLVRAIADVQHTFRFGSTAAWYIEAAGRRRISRKSVQFFADWTEERIQRLRNNVPNEEALAPVIQWHSQAKAYWDQRTTRANAE